MLAAASEITAQTKPTQAELDQWAKDPDSQVLETSTCKKVTWLLEAEKDRPNTQRPIRYALAWWGRGFIEGAVYMIGEKAQKAASRFGLSADVVAAHISTYCYAHQTEAPFEAVQDLLLKVLKTAD